ncbi:hypothetical protein JTB14_036348 [Gonioctena quinquepunctata]|nr:hypothetical protein JTB14_036348 [Gonioctena quinquepunctata]
MYCKKTYSDENLTIAIQAVKDGDLSYKKASTLYRIPRSTLIVRVKGWKNSATAARNTIVMMRETTMIDTESSDASDMESWVIVTYSTEKTLKRSVGEVIEVLDENIRVTFLKMKGEYFVWPDVQDIDTINKDDVLQILPSPKEERRGELYFSVKFDGLNVQ